MRRRTPTQRSGRGPRALLLGLVALVAVLAAACRAEARVDVAVAPDGSGTVTVTVSLDPAAAAQLGDPEQVSLDDLRQAGWSVAPVRREDDGGLRWAVRRRFASPQQLGRVLDEVGGAGGVFSGTRLTVDDGFGSTSYSFSTRVTLTGDLSQFSDPALAQALGGVPVGWTAEELTAAGATAPGATRLVLSVRLPGDRPTTDGRVVAGAARWTYPLSSGRPTREAATSSSQDGSLLAPALVVAGGALVLAAVVLLVLWWARGRRRR